MSHDLNSTHQVVIHSLRQVVISELVVCPVLIETYSNIEMLGGPYTKLLVGFERILVMHETVGNLIAC